jgi:hypothetical protein
MKCNHCGASVEESDLFCGECGKRLETELRKKDDGQSGQPVDRPVPSAIPDRAASPEAPSPVVGQNKPAEPKVAVHDEESRDTPASPPTPQSATAIRVEDESPAQPREGRQDDTPPDAKTPLFSNPVRIFALISGVVILAALAIPDDGKRRYTSSVASDSSSSYSSSTSTQRLSLPEQSRRTEESWVSRVVDYREKYGFALVFSMPGEWKHGPPARSDWIVFKPSSRKNLDVVVMVKAFKSSQHVMSIEEVKTIASNLTDMEFLTDPIYQQIDGRKALFLKFLRQDPFPKILGKSDWHITGYETNYKGFKVYVNALCKKAACNGELDTTLLSIILSLHIQGQ